LWKLDSSLNNWVEPIFMCICFLTPNYSKDKSIEPSQSMFQIIIKLSTTEIDMNPSQINSRTHVFRPQSLVGPEDYYSITARIKSHLPLSPGSTRYSPLIFLNDQVPWPSDNSTCSSSRPQMASPNVYESNNKFQGVNENILSNCDPSFNFTCVLQCTCYGALTSNHMTSEHHLQRHRLIKRINFSLQLL